MTWVEVTSLRRKPAPLSPVTRNPQYLNAPLDADQAHQYSGQNRGPSDGFRNSLHAPQATRPHLWCRTLQNVSFCCTDSRRNRRHPKRIDAATPATIISSHPVRRPATSPAQSPLTFRASGLGSKSHSYSKSRGVGIAPRH